MIGQRVIRFARMIRTRHAYSSVKSILSRVTQGGASNCPTERSDRVRLTLHGPIPRSPTDSDLPPILHHRYLTHMLRQSHKYTVCLVIGAIITGSVWTAAQASADEQKLLRIGIIGLDTSHAIAFTKELNRDQASDVALQNLRVVAATPTAAPTSNPALVEFRPTPPISRNSEFRSSIRSTNC